MPEEINQPNPNPNTPNFTTKAVETPILDSDLRGKIGPGGMSVPAKSFYQANKLYFWAILAGILIIGFLSFFAFRKSPVAAPKQANVSININVPQTVSSGGEAVFQITVQNNDSQTLTNLQLELAYPQGMTYENSSPNAQNLTGSLFNIPDLIAGQNATVIIKTQVTGNVNDQMTLDAKLHYSYSNFNSQFVQDQTATIRLVASAVSVTLTAPSQTSNSQLVVYTVNYQNNSDQDIQNARVMMQYPDGFVFGSSQPTPDLGSDTWNVGTLAKGGTGTIQIQGMFNSANPGESKTATAQFLILGPDGNYFVQNSDTGTTNISSLPLLVTQAVQSTGSNEHSGVVNPGDSLTFNITYQNNASTVATGVNVEVDLNSKVIDPASITAQGGQVNNSSIIWNASGVPQLASVLPNQSGQLSFNLRVNNPATRDSSTNLEIVSSIQIKSNEYVTALPGNQLTLKVSSPAQLNTSVSYVSGSLPPAVGKPTVYKVTFSLTNSSNDFSNGVLTAFIPVASGGFAQSSVNPAEASNIQFDTSTSQLTWNFGSLPANTGRFSQPRLLSFNVTLSPGASDSGQILTLVKTIGFTATDLFTNQPVNVTAQNITTNDLQGQQGMGSGTVQ